MTYGGLEIDMLSLGDADCILVTQWDNDNPTHVLIDGGRAESVETVRTFLQKRGITYIHHVVCSHLHEDHAGGLVELIKDERFEFGKAWVHKPNLHVNRERVDKSILQAKESGLKSAEVMYKSWQTNDALLSVLKSRRIFVEEPFQGKTIAFLTICGPSVEYYEELLEQFADYNTISALVLTEELQDLTEQIEKLDKSYKSSVVLGGDSPGSENESSVVLYTAWSNTKYLFTADAGPEALGRAKASNDLSECTWMQIPHHGSRRNITEDLIAHFCPKSAFVSASGSAKHPRREVVEAFQKVGTKVYSTHYPYDGHLRQQQGHVPPPVGYTSLCPLWEADE